MKFCKYCNCDHPLTKEWWYFRPNGLVSGCKQKTKDSANARYESKREEIIRSVGQHYLRHKDEKVQYNVDYEKRRRAIDSSYKLARLFRGRFRYEFFGRKKTNSVINFLGASVDEVRRYIESLWLPHMSWENHGMGPGTWQIDHIKQLSLFDMTDPEQAKIAWNYKNLQPLWYELMKRLADSQDV